LAFHSSLLAFAWSSRKAESFSDDRTVKICGKIYEKVRRLVYDCAYVSVLQPHVPLSLSPKRFQCFSHLGDEDYSAMVLIMETPFGKDDLMAMLDSVEDAVVKLDGSAKYVAMNKAAADIFRRLGQDPQAMIGKSMWEVFPDLKGSRRARTRLGTQRSCAHQIRVFLSRGPALVRHTRVSLSSWSHSRLSRHHRTEKRLAIIGQQPHGQSLPTDNAEIRPSRPTTGRVSQRWTIFETSITFAPHDGHARHNDLSSFTHHSNLCRCIPADARCSN